MLFTKEQIFIVTGASSGLGEATALMLNKEGASVIAIARNVERLNKLKEKAEHPENVFIEVKDLTEDIEGLPDYVKMLKDKYGKLQGLAYCAGIVCTKPARMLNYNEIQELFAIDYFAPFFLMKGFADKRNNTGKGAAAVAISSASAYTSDRGMSAYSGVKAALIASLKSLAREVVTSGVRINTVSPSDIKTPMTMNPELVELRPNKEAEYPLGFGEPCDVANMIVYLLSDKAKWITAKDYIIDCGVI